MIRVCAIASRSNAYTSERGGVRQSKLCLRRARYLSALPPSNFDASNFSITS